MRANLEAATVEDAAAIAQLRRAANDKLTAQYGKGFWSSNVSDKGVLFDMRRSKVFLVKDISGTLIATLTISRRKPWSIDEKYFTSVQRPLYLTAMAVAPQWQGKGVGRRCIEEAKAICEKWPADAIRLDAYDAAAGAGEFYRTCGFREVGRTSYRKTPVIYFEMLL
jgi:GNAT superfamily N-acetyltransferase